MGADKKVGWFRGEGGSVFQMDLPLPKDIQSRVTKGLIVRVGGPAGEEFIPEGWVPASTEAAPGPVGRPDDDASKSAWIGYAVRTLGVDPEVAEGMTRQDLIDKAAEAAVQQPEQHGAGPDSEDDEPAPVKPKAADPKDSWVAYIVATTDRSETEARDLTKADLIALANE